MVFMMIDEKEKENENEREEYYFFNSFLSQFSPVSGWKYYQVCPSYEFDVACCLPLLHFS